ncbi:hypothetical protein [Nocardia sp. NPDC058480]
MTSNPAENSCSEILSRWEAFHLARVACAVQVFALIVATTLLPAKEIQR